MAGDRRPLGTLEAEVLAALWAEPRGATAAEVREALGGGLAHTTVVTVLGRLWRKGHLDREREGRAHRYRPRLRPSELAAQRMQAQLEQVEDRRGVLSRFVSGLSPGDEEALRRVLEELDQP